MTDFLDYEGSVVVIYNGSQLAECKSIEVNDTANLRKAMTLKKGVAGWARGHGESTITIEELVPVAGREALFLEQMKAGTQVSVEVQMGGKTFRRTGKINSVGSSSAPEGDPVAERVEIMGGPVEIL